MGRLTALTCALLLGLVPAALVGQDRTVAGSITSTTCPGTGCVELSTLSEVGSGAVQVTGTWVATLQFEGTVDGSTYASLLSIDPATGLTSATSTTANGTFLLPLAGFRHARVRASAYTSGTAVVTVRSTAGTVRAFPGVTALSQTGANNDVDVLTLPALPAGTNNIGDVDVLTLPSVTIGTFPDNEPINLAQVGGVAVLTGNGITGTGSLRVTIASDNTAFSVNVANTPTVTVGTFPDNEPVNVAQVGGTAILTGNGVTGAGSPRVTIASDNSAFSVNVGTFPDNEPVNVAQMNGVAVTMGLGVAGTGVQRTAEASDGTGPAFNGATAATVPGRAAYIGGNSSGNLTGIIACDTNALLNMSTATTTQIVALTASQRVYICSAVIMAGGTANVKLVGGTGTNCATGQTDLSANYPLTAQTGLSRGSGVGMIWKSVAGDAVCVTSSAAVTVAIDVTYTKFP